MMKKSNSSVFESLLLREPIFHHPDRFGRTREAILDQMDANFWEVGASGTIYTKAEVISTLLKRYGDPAYQDIWKMESFKVSCLCANVYMATYTLIQDHIRITRRSTLWKSITESSPTLWKAIYHQGTLASNQSKHPKAFQPI